MDGNSDSGFLDRKEKIRRSFFPPVPAGNVLVARPHLSPVAFSQMRPWAVAVHGLALSPDT